MGTEWYYAHSGVQKGPITEEKLKALFGSGQLRSSDLVWHDGMDQWTQAANIEGLVPKQAFVGASPPPLPPPSTSLEWYYAQGSVQKGPITSEEIGKLLASGEIQPDDLVWREGMSQWAKAAVVEELRPLLPAPPIIQVSPGSQQFDLGPVAQKLKEGAKKAAAELPEVAKAAKTRVVGWADVVRKKVAALQAAKAPEPPSATATPSGSPPPVPMAVPSAQSASSLFAGGFSLRKVPKWVWGCLGVLVLLAGGIRGCLESGNGISRETSTKPGARSEAIKINAEELVTAYKSNEVAADQRYKGRVLEVSGTIDSIGKDILDNMYVSLKGGGDFEMRGVQCFFAERHKSTLANLSQGTLTTIRGTCDGLMIHVLLNNCEIVK